MTAAPARLLFRQALHVLDGFLPPPGGDQRAEPIVIGGVHQDLPLPLGIEQIGVIFRRVFGGHHLGVVGENQIVGEDAGPISLWIFELVETASKNHCPARVSLSIRFINCSSPARTRSALMNGYSFRKASSNGLEVSMAIEVYQTTLPSFLAASIN